MNTHGDREENQLGSAQLQVIGPVQLVLSPGQNVPLSKTQRKLLAALALVGPEQLSIENLIFIVWDGAPPSTARTALHNQISRIRQRVDTPVVETIDDGYRLVVPTDIDDLAALHAHTLTAMQREDYEGVFTSLSKELSASGLIPFEDLADLPIVEVGRNRVDELYYSLENLRLQAARTLGLIDWVVPEAYRLALTARHDERRWQMVIESLTQAGRRGDALAAFEQARRILAEDLGIEPGELLRAAEHEILGASDNRLRRHMMKTVEHGDLVDTAAAAAVAGSWVELVGESGIGKSSLILRLARKVRSEGAQSVMISVRRYASDAIAPLLDIVEGLGIDPETIAIPVPGFMAALRDYVRVEGPIVILIDDIHLAGPTVVEAVRQAATVPGVGIVVTSLEPTNRVDPTRVATNSPSSASADGHTFVISSLSREQVGELCQRFLDPELGLDTHLQDWLWQMSGGNPAFLEYLLGDVQFTDWWITHHDDEVLPPVTGLRDVVRTQLGQLGRQATDVLQLVAVAGPVLTIDEVASILGRGGLPAVLEAGWLTASQIESDAKGSPWLAFRHGAVKRIVYDDIPGGQQIELHRIVANLLRLRGESAAAYAEHALAAWQLDPHAAYESCMAAGDEAFRDAAYADAGSWYDSAANIAPTIDGQEHGQSYVAAMVKRADVSRCLGHEDQVERLFDAIDWSLELEDPALVSQAVFAALQLGSTTESGQIHERAATAVDVALKILPVGDQRGIVMGASTLVMSMTESSELMRERFLEAVAMTTTDEVRGALLPFGYLSLGHPQDLQLRLRNTAELHVLSHRLGSPIVRFETCQMEFSNAIMTANGHKLRWAIRQLEAIFPFIGDIGRRWSLLYQQAALAHIEGRLDDAEQISDDAFAVFSPVSFSRAFAAYGGQILPIRIAQGRVGELTETIGNLLVEQPEVPAWNAAYALAIADSDPEQAAVFASKARTATSRDFTWMAAHVVAARAAAKTDDVELCSAFVSDLLPWSGLVCWQGTCSYGPVDTVLGQLAKVLGNDKDAAKYQRQALRQSDSLGSVVFWDEAAAL